MEAIREIPEVFIGSSSEGLGIAYAVQEELEHDANATVWSQGIFQLSSNILDDLLRTLDKTDFGIFVFSADDVLKIRDQHVLSVRDNVIFELGLFIGRLGKERSFFIIPNNDNRLHLPTDLLGITPATFNADRKDIRAAIGPACNKIRRSIKDLGKFSKIDNSTAFLTLEAAKKLSEAWVLWVDDIPTNNTYVRQALEAFGIRFTTSISTEDALQKVRLKNYNVIISDGGRQSDPRACYTLWEKLKEKGINTPFIIYSPRRSSKDIVEDLKKGVYGASNSGQELLDLVINAIKNG
jgi:CheY-like chemotaxis protein